MKGLFSIIRVPFVILLLILSSCEKEQMTEQANRANRKFRRKFFREAGERKKKSEEEKRAQEEQAQLETQNFRTKFFEVMQRKKRHIEEGQGDTENLPELQREEAGEEGGQLVTQSLLAPFLGVMEKKKRKIQEDQGDVQEQVEVIEEIRETQIIEEENAELAFQERFLRVMEKKKRNREEVQPLALRLETEMDVIWVIDPRIFMGENSEQLKEKFQSFVSKFATFSFDFKNVLLSTDYSERGAPYGEISSLNRLPYGRDPDLLVDNFMEALAGIESKDALYVERGFANVRHFMGTSEGKRFLSRKDAYTIIIFVSNADDQSESLLEESRKYLLSVERYVNRYRVVANKNPHEGSLKIYSIINLSEDKLTSESLSREKVGKKYRQASVLTGGLAIDIHDDFKGVLDAILDLPSLPLAKNRRPLDLNLSSP